MGNQVIDMSQPSRSDPTQINRSTKRYERLSMNPAPAPLAPATAPHLESSKV